MFWGISEALDLVEEYSRPIKRVTDKRPTGGKEIKIKTELEALKDERPAPLLVEKETENNNNIVLEYGAADTCNPIKHKNNDISAECKDVVDGLIENIFGAEHENEQTAIYNVELAPDLVRTKDEEMCATEEEVKGKSIGEYDFDQQPVTGSGNQASDISNDCEIQTDSEDKTMEQQENIDSMKDTTAQKTDSPVYESQEKDKFNGGTPLPKSLNILLFGSGDPRHIIKTIAKLYEKKLIPKAEHIEGTPNVPEISFYVLEACIELTARVMMLLSIALEDPTTFNLRSKVHLFMDVYGNALMRPISEQYLAGKGKILSQMITDDDFRAILSPNINTDNLLYFDRDLLDDIFSFYRPQEMQEVDMKTLWSNKLRASLKERYDYRKGAFDWDLSMVLKDRGANQICSQEYTHYRETGIAFTFPEHEYCKTNKTLLVSVRRQGRYFTNRSLIGDFPHGPFMAFGLKTADGTMMQSMHGDNDYRATDITERNLLEIFHELHTRTPYVHDLEMSRKYGSVRLLMGNQFTHNEPDRVNMDSIKKPWLHIPGVNIYFLPAREINNIHLHWENFFDVVFFAHNYFPLIKPDIEKILRDDALAIFETKLFTTLHKEDVAKNEAKLMVFAESIGLQSVINYKVFNTKNSLLRYRKVGKKPAAQEAGSNSIGI